MATDIPGASVYLSAVEMAKKRYQTRLADINKQRQSTLRTSGFTGDIDPSSGLITNQRIDPYSQYGQLQQLNRSQALRYDELQGLNTSRRLGSRGGLGAQNLGNLRYEFGKEDATFGANLTDVLGQYTRQQEDELFGYNEALYRAQQAAAQSAITAGDYGPPENEGDPYDYPPYTDGAAENVDDPFGVRGLNELLASIKPAAYTKAVSSYFKPKKKVTKKPALKVSRGIRGGV